MESTDKEIQSIKQTTLKERLLHPQIPAVKPLDKLFVEIVEFLEVPKNGKPIDHIYSKLSTDDKCLFGKRMTVITKALDYLLKIQQLSNEEKRNSTNKELITISLPDMRIFGELLNLIIVEGFYSLFPNGVGVPLDRRRLKIFNKSSVSITRTKDPQHAELLLQTLVSRLFQIFENGGDVKGLLMRGSGYSDLLTGAISLMCNPSSTSENTEQYKDQFFKIEKICPTFELFSLYTLLLQPYSQPWIKLFASKRLSLVSIERTDGVMSLIEFVVGMRDDEDISIEKIDHVSRILISKPQSVTSVEYFSSIGRQLYDILVLINRPLLTSIATHIVESIFERNQSIVKDFIFKRAWNNLNPEPSSSDDDILTSEKDLNNTINFIISLSKKSSSELLNVLFEPLLLSLWSYLLFNKKTLRETGPIVDIFISYFTITYNQVALDTLVNNLLTLNGEGWSFAVGPNNLIQIKENTSQLELSNEEFFNILDTGVSLMISIMKGIDDDLLRKEFSVILKRWLKVSDSKIESLSEDTNPFLLLIDLKLLESIVEQFKERLSRSPGDMLIVVKNVLLNNQENMARVRGKQQVKQQSIINIVPHEELQGDSDDEDNEDEENELSESLKVVLELLSAILSETSVDKLSLSAIDTLKEILVPLSDLASSNKSAQSLQERITRLLEGGLPAEKTEDDIDKISLGRAITSLNDPLVPIRAHGLFLLRQLIIKKSNAISLENAIDLHLLQLKDPEPFIYLNVVKGLDSLITYNKNEVLPMLLSIYRNDKYSLDERLRIGEVLLRFITHSNDTLSGEISSEIASTTLGIIRIPSSSDLKQENTLRMSAMSLLGMCCKTNPVGIIDHLLDCFDCVLGILNLETSEELLIMRRSAVVLIYDLISGPGGLESVPKTYGSKCLTVLKYITETDNDLLVRDQLRDVLHHINELFKQMWEIEEDPSLNKFKI